MKTAQEVKAVDAARMRASAQLLQSKSEAICAFVQAEMDRLSVGNEDLAALVHCAMLRVANAAILIDHGQPVWVKPAIEANEGNEANRDESNRHGCSLAAAFPPVKP